MEDPARPNDGRPTHTGEEQQQPPAENPPAENPPAENPPASNPPAELSDDEILERAAKITETRAAQANEI